MSKFNWKYFIVSLLLLALLGPVKFSLGDVPITLQTFILFTTAAVFGKQTGLYATFTYLILGAFGLPVFGGYTSGWEKFIGSTAGFLWAFPFIAYYVGWEAEKRPLTFYHFTGIFLKAHFILLIPGFIVLYLSLEGIRLWDTFIRLVPGLFLKSLAGGFISVFLIKKLPAKQTEVPINN